MSPEPPGPNCPNGGVKIETGIDTNENGMLDENEVTDTVYVCNGEPGEDGGSKCSLTPANSISDPSALLGLLAYILIPAAIVVRRRFRKEQCSK